MGESFHTGNLPAKTAGYERETKSGWEWRGAKPRGLKVKNSNKLRIGEWTTSVLR